MKKILWALLPISIAVSAEANEQVIHLENCSILDRFLERGSVIMECDTTNSSETPVRNFSYSYTTKTKGRTVPWDSHEGAHAWVSGGIEPGETVKVLLRAGSLPSRASLDGIVVDLSPLIAFDVNGDPIE